MTKYEALQTIGIIEMQLANYKQLLTELSNYQKSTYDYNIVDGSVYYGRLRELTRNSNIDLTRSIKDLIEFVATCDDEQENELTDEMPDQENQPLKDSPAQEEASEEEQAEVGEFPIKDILDMLFSSNEEYRLVINRTRSALRCNQISSFSQLENLRVSNMIRWANIGTKTMGLVLAICKHYGISVDMSVDGVGAFTRSKILKANEMMDMFNNVLVFAD